jgi:hypothetical protein
MRYVLVHGAAVRRCRTHLPNLEEYLELAPVETFCPGYILMLSAHWLNRRAATRLAAVLQPGDIVIAHSNGCHIADLAMRKWPDIESTCRLVALSPALDKDYAFSVGWETVDVFYNPGDRLSWLARHIPCHPWGAMMGAGIMGRRLRMLPQERNHNIPEFVGRNLNYEHNLYLQPPIVEAFAIKLERYLSAK